MHIVTLWRWCWEQRLVPFLVVGGISTVINLLVLFVLTHSGGVWYLYSEAVAFLISYGINFTLQRKWTFRHGTRSMSGQLALHLPWQLINLGLDETSLYILVEYFGLWYLLAQFITGAWLAGISFLVTRQIFKQ